MRMGRLRDAALLMLVLVAGNSLPASAVGLRSNRADRADRATDQLTDQVIDRAAERSATEARSLLSQSPDLGCRQINTLTGIYEQPDLNSASRGVLPVAQVVKIELAQAGTGWARINSPLIGWVEAKYLSPPVACGTGSTVPQSVAPSPATPTAPQPQLQPSPTPQPSSAPALPRPDRNISTFPEPNLPSNQAVRPSVSVPPPATARSSNPTSSNPVPSGTDRIASIAVTCDVLSPRGLDVWSEPVISQQTLVTTLPRGTYTFRFTRNTRRVQTDAGILRWVYIVAPSQGWITTGIIGRTPVLGGQQCG